ncbi:LADA_0B08680g1_1 [Lachancea dasiensis]|uniref:LADA_0B08680g1_1 n=1 Tax=Lachancea dasiensis TaxID=1072105 RepID=A0A1G4IUI8_9SACH|nr:LADA_0B08680g1_1 [Lachancea dasiensis]
MTSQLGSIFEREVDEYVSRVRLRKRLREWLSSSSSWFSSLGNETYSTHNYSYDTEQLELLLMMNGLKHNAATLSSSCPTSGTRSTETSTPRPAKVHEPKAIARRGRFVRLCHRFRNACRKPEIQSANNAAILLSEKYGFEADPWSVADTGYGSLSFRAREFPEQCDPAPSTDILTLLERRTAGFEDRNL